MEIVKNPTLSVRIDSINSRLTFVPTDTPIPQYTYFYKMCPFYFSTFVEDESRPITPNLSGELNQSLVSRSGKHVHFAPDLNAILSDLDEVGIIIIISSNKCN